MAGIFISGFANAQVEIVKWTFPTGQLSDTVQNNMSQFNITRVIRSEGTSAITMTNGQIAGDYAATATGWDNGMDIKNWYISFQTENYINLKISSKQRAGGTNGGPKDFKLQYKIGESGTWTDIAGGTVTLANNWISGNINNLSLPAECQDLPSLVYVRWIMASNTDVNGGTLSANGISKIDEIIVTGDLILSEWNKITVNIIGIYPNPSKGDITINTNENPDKIEVYNLNGKLIYSIQPKTEFTKISLKKGIYCVQIQSIQGRLTKKIIIE